MEEGERKRERERAGKVECSDERWKGLQDAEEKSHGAISKSLRRFTGKLFPRARQRNRGSHT